jgi:predicted DNA-binding transcriptional regulator AlpA
MMTEKSTSLLVNSRDAAQLLSISERSLWTHMKSGSLPHVRIGRSVRYDIVDLREWIDDQKQKKHSNQIGGISND